MSSYLIKKKCQRYSKTIKCGASCLEGDIYVNGGFGGRFGGYHIYYHLEWVSKNNSTQADIVHMFNDTKIDININ